MSDEALQRRLKPSLHHADIFFCQMTRLRSGQVCAAFVPLPGDDGESWIITRIEKTLENGDYVVRDEQAVSREHEHYVVKPSHVTHFPTPNAKYQPNEQVLALWYNEEQREWSTTFYEATVIRIEDSKLIIKFTGSSVLVETDESKLARLPPDFNAEETPAPEEETHPEPIDAPRRIHFVRGEAPDSIPKHERITNEQLTEMMEPDIPIRRVVSIEGTPLLDMLEDADLFPQDAPHVMVSGSMRVQYQSGSKPIESGLVDGEKKVGRLTRVFKEWRV